MQYLEVQKLCRNAMALYCDFETFLVPVEDSCTTSKTVTKELHKPSGVSCLLVAQDPKYTEDIFTYSGPDVIDVFINHLKEQEEFVSDVISKVFKMNSLSEEEQKIHSNAKNCKLCGNCFQHDKVRHHDHITGCHIGPYCTKCNLQLKFRKGRNDKKRKSTPYYGGRKKFCGDAGVIPDDAKIDELISSEFEINGDNFMLPVFFHNLKGFDSHIIMTYVNKNFAPSDIQVIPTTSQKYIFSKSAVSDS